MKRFILFAFFLLCLPMGLAWSQVPSETYTVAPGQTLYLQLIIEPISAAPTNWSNVDDQYQPFSESGQIQISINGGSYQSQTISVNPNIAQCSSAAPYIVPCFLDPSPADWWGSPWLEYSLPNALWKYTNNSNSSETISIIHDTIVSEYFTFATTPPPQSYSLKKGQTIYLSRVFQPFWVCPNNQVPCSDQIQIQGSININGKVQQLPNKSISINGGMSQCSSAVNPSTLPCVEAWGDDYNNPNGGYFNGTNLNINNALYWYSPANPPLYYTAQADETITLTSTNGYGFYFGATPPGKSILIIYEGGLLNVSGLSGVKSADQEQFHYFYDAIDNNTQFNILSDPTNPNSEANQLSDNPNNNDPNYQWDGTKTYHITQISADPGALGDTSMDRGAKLLKKVDALGDSSHNYDAIYILTISSGFSSVEAAVYQAYQSKNSQELAFFAKAHIISLSALLGGAQVPGLASFLNGTPAAKSTYPGVNSPIQTQLDNFYKTFISPQVIKSFEYYIVNYDAAFGQLWPIYYKEALPNICDPHATGKGANNGCENVLYRLWRLQWNQVFENEIQKAPSKIYNENDINIIPNCPFTSGIYPFVGLDLHLVPLCDQNLVDSLVQRIINGT